jgi:hypothetical protein
VKGEKGILNISNASKIENNGRKYIYIDNYLKKKKKKKKKGKAVPCCTLR